MFTAENEDVLATFQALCEQYPRENPVALWEMAGGQTAAEHHAHADGACPHADTINPLGRVFCPDCRNLVPAPQVA